MDQLHLMKVFVAVAEEHGFAAASRRLNMSPPAVTRAIATLEDRLGVTLLQRTTRFVRTTDAGARYLEDSRSILQRVDCANEAARGINEEPSGHLSITAPVLFGQRFVMPGVVDYLKAYPETQIDAVFLDRVVNLLEEGFDVGIRIGKLPDSSMRALRVGTVRLILVASPNYLATHGIPQSPAELENHTLIASNSGSLTQDWHFNDKGKDLAVRIKPRLSVCTNQSSINAAQEDLGITRVLSYQVAQELESGSLKIVLEHFEPDPLPVHVVHREGRLSSTKVRSFIDLMADRLKNNKALN